MGAQIGAVGFRFPTLTRQLCQAGKVQILELGRSQLAADMAAPRPGRRWVTRYSRHTVPDSLHLSVRERSQCALRLSN